MRMMQGMKNKKGTPPAPPGASHAPPSRVPFFRLSDQFGRDIDATLYTGVPLIIVAGNREGAGGVALWTAAFRAEIGDQGGASVLPVADLGGVPRVVRRLVRRLLPREPAHWCAIDWDGQVGAPVRGAHGPLVAAAYGEDGALRMWEVLPLDIAEPAMLARLIGSTAS